MLLVQPKIKLWLGQLFQHACAQAAPRPRIPALEPSWG